jgi:hypothetical protein
VGRPRKAVKRKQRVNGIDPTIEALLFDDEPPENANPFEVLLFEPEQHWPTWREQVMSLWIETRPGTRPSCWWLFDAPRMNDPGKHTGCEIAKTMCEPRKLLAGMGQPAWQVYNLSPRYHLGICADWTGGDPKRLVFESQYDYLARFRLLEAGEGSSAEPVFVPEKFL